MSGLLAKNSPDSLTAEALLAIQENEPEALFSAGSLAAIKSEYRALAKLWHPDRNTATQAKDVTQRLQALYKKAKEKIERTDWQAPNLLRFSDLTGKNYEMHYEARHPFELGEMYIGAKSIAFKVGKTDKKLFENAKDIVSNLKYPDVEMTKRLSPYLPQLRGTYETPDSYIMVLKKDPDMILLRDVLNHQKGKIEPVHAAWMVSRLHNFGCYLQWAGLTHNAISVDTCFISPKDHAIGLYGGWWYAAKEGDKLKALPPKTVAVTPPSILDNPKATARIDMALIRATGREILGDATGMRLIGDKTIPKPFSQWVNGASSGDANQDYKIWSSDVLIKSFGARRFVEMKLTPNDIYQP